MFAHTALLFFLPSLLVGYVHTVELLRTPCNHATRKLVLACSLSIDKLDICRSESSSIHRLATTVSRNRCAHSKRVTTNWRGSHVYNAPTLLSSPLRDPRACTSTCMYMFSLVFRGGTRRARVHATCLPSLLLNSVRAKFLLRALRRTMIYRWCTRLYLGISIIRRVRSTRALV